MSALITSHMYIAMMHIHYHSHHEEVFSSSNEELLKAVHNFNSVGHLLIHLKFLRNLIILDLSSPLL